MLLQPSLTRDATETLTTFLSQLRPDAPASTNQGTQNLAFQRWFKFKEAFSPAFVANIISQLPHPPGNCCDPFGGSGTTALTAQFLGIRPTTIELNPFLADLIEAKTTSYDAAQLSQDWKDVVSSVRKLQPAVDETLHQAPATLCEPGVNGRWIFDRDVFQRIFAYREAISALGASSHRRLLRVLLGSVLVHLSNVVVNGKGRRYRGGWQRQRRLAADVDSAMASAFAVAIEDITRMASRACPEAVVIRGDARSALCHLDEKFDLILFSPPYPNSFDYTDIYNLELWALGYLRGREDNALLRRSTLSSHVQIDRPFGRPPESSRTLLAVVDKLRRRSSDLWSRRIPDMIGGYFADLEMVLADCARLSTPTGRTVIVVGDSQYAGVTIPVAQILGEIAGEVGLSVRRVDQLRPMRASAQQGGEHALAEAALWLST